MELEWVHHVPLDENGAKRVRERMIRIKLSIISWSQYINLAALEEEKCKASINQIVNAANM